jgi:hypothetical protein
VLILPVLAAGCMSFSTGSGPLLTSPPLASSGPQFFIDLVDSRAPWERNAYKRPWAYTVPDDPPAVPRSVLAPPGDETIPDWQDETDIPLLLSGQAKLAYRSMRLLLNEDDKRSMLSQNPADDGGHRYGEVLSFFSFGLRKTW